MRLPWDSATGTSGNRGRKRSEDQNPQLAIDIRLIVEPQTHTDPELKTDRLYTNLSAGEVRHRLLECGYSEEELPSERTLVHLGLSWVGPVDGRLPDFSEGGIRTWKIGSFTSRFSA